MKVKCCNVAIEEWYVTVVVVVVPNPGDKVSCLLTYLFTITFSLMIVLSKFIKSRILICI